MQNHIPRIYFHSSSTVSITYKIIIIIMKIIIIEIIERDLFNRLLRTLINTSNELSARFGAC